jgi:hypothetical protein
MSSDGGLEAPEALARQDAIEVVGFLREMEREYGDSRKPVKPLRKTVRGVLEKRLIKAKELLGSNHWVVDILNELLDAIIHAQVDFRLIHEDAAYVACALEDGFVRGPGRRTLPPEARVKQDAREVVGFLREMERKCEDPDERDNELRDVVCNVLAERLTKATELLSSDRWIIDILDELYLEAMACHATFDLAQENAALVAQNLEDRFELRAGGGNGDIGWAITEHSKFGSWISVKFPFS